MLARVRSAAVLGIDAYLVEVETDIANGLPTFVTVGLPQGAVKEGRDRVSAALANTGFTFPLRRITVNLAPADIRKEGSAFDLPIALGILAATEQVKGERLGKVAVLGELGLEGGRRAARGGNRCADPAARESAGGWRRGRPPGPGRELPLGNRRLPGRQGGAGERGDRRREAVRRARARRRGFRGSERTAPRQAGARGRRRRQSQHPDGRPARLRQDDAGATT